MKKALLLLLGISLFTNSEAQSSFIKTIDISDIDAFSSDSKHTINLSDGSYATVISMWHNSSDSNVGLLLRNASGDTVSTSYVGRDTTEITLETPVKIRETSDNKLVVLSNGYGVGNTASGLLKMELDGSVIWNREMVTATSTNINYTDLIEANDGGFICLGKYVDPIDDEHVLITKFDVDGMQEWSKLYSIPNPSLWTRDLTQTTTGDIIVSGYHVTSTTENDAFIISTSNTGTLNWSSEFSIPGLVIIKALNGNADGSILISGNKIASLGADHEGFVGKLDASGTVLWLNDYQEDDEWSDIRFIGEHPDGGYYGSGINEISGAGAYTTTRIHDNGDVIWSSGVIGGSFSLHGAGLTADGGYFYSYDDITTFTETLIKTDSSGIPFCDHLTLDVTPVPSGLTVNPLAVVETTLALTEGDVNTTTFPHIEMTPNVDCSNVGIEEDAGENPLTLYPNPAQDYVQFSRMVNGAIMTIDGRVISEFENCLKLDVSQLDAGMYLISVGDEILRLIKL